MSTPFKAPFPTIIPATFVKRPNRFILIVRLESGRLVRAFLPNPGRLQELLLPETTVYLAPAPQAPERKTQFTAIGIAGEKHPIFLHTHVTNAVARHLLESKQIPGLKQARILRSEAPLGNSRFDFLLEHRGKPVYLEVKSCTLFGNRGAMFPDAITERGRRHLEELAALARAGTKTAVLFVVHSAEVDWFMPDFHTDQAFTETLLDVRNDVQIIPLAIGWREDFTLLPGTRKLPIPWRHVARETGDRGNYILLLKPTRSRRKQTREPGFYLAAGWCDQALRKFLRQLPGERTAGAAPANTLPEGLDLVEAFPIVSSTNHEPALRGALQDLGQAVAVSDAPATHEPLYHRTNDPRTERRFHTMLARFRMVHPPSMA